MPHTGPQADLPQLLFEYQILARAWLEHRGGQPPLHAPPPASEAASEAAHEEAAAAGSMALAGEAAAEDAEGTRGTLEPQPLANGLADSAEELPVELPELDSLLDGVNEI